MKTFFTDAEFNALFNYRGLRGITDIEPFEGWRRMKEPGRLVKGFPHLSLNPAYVLRGFHRLDSAGGNGIVFAMRKGSRWPDWQSMRSKTAVVYFTQPPEAVPDLMQVIEGECTPETYLSASLFCRDIQELGAYWHGAGWSDHTLLFEAPERVIKDMKEQKARRRRLSKEERDWIREQTGENLIWAENNGYWRLLEKMPTDLRPCVRMNRYSVTVTFFTHAQLVLP